MQLFRWQGRARNFGDELNALLWPALMPTGWFETAGEALFLGIGSVLDGRHPTGLRKIVAGAGYGGYEAPAALDRSWIIHWVRGPRTARALNLPEGAGLGDPATLVGAIAPPPLPGTAGPVGFMPHFESAQAGDWARAAALAGLRFIDPRGEPAQVLAEVRDCRVLLSEAMHGVIVADALRVPWIAIRPRMRIHRAKWADWGDGMGLVPRWRDLPATSWTEALRAHPLASPRAGRHLVAAGAPLLGWLTPAAWADRAAAALHDAARATPQLSADAALDRAVSRMRGALEILRRAPFRPQCLPLPASPPVLRAHRVARVPA